VIVIWGIALGSLAAWIYLLAWRGLFWLARERDADQPLPDPPAWPSVCAVVPARNEADVIGRAVSRLLAQDYPGAFRVVVVDDGSDDGTAVAARAVADAAAAERLEVLAGAPLPQGWTGKLWAMTQGADAAAAQPDYLLFTDADIEHAADSVRRLVARAEAGKLVLVSLMAKLRCDTFAETMLIPAFVFFFDMLYPFANANDPRSPVAAAAGGCMLVRREALAAAGGLAAIRAEIIDDCALARRMKAHGPIWLGLTERVHSLRSYGGFAGIGRMVSRSAYAQLGYSPLILVGTIAGMGITYLAPPLVGLAAPGLLRAIGLLTWLLMALSFQPMLAFYRRSFLWGAALPAIGAVYCLFTVQSALDVWRGRGGQWKGRAQALAARS